MKSKPIIFALLFVSSFFLNSIKVKGQGTCATAVSIPSLPYTQTGLSNCGKGDHYSGTPACLVANAFGGEDYLFSYTPTVNQCVNASAVLSAAPWAAGIAIVDKCPTTAGATCLASSTGGTSINGNSTLGLSNVSLTAGTTYYFIVSGGQALLNSPPTGVCFTFDFSVQECPPPPPPPYNNKACGLNYVHADVLIEKRTSGSAPFNVSPPFNGNGTGLPSQVTIAGLPACFVIDSAYLYFDASYFQPIAPTPTVSITNPANTTSGFNAVVVGESSDVNWGETGVATYRTNVTSSISGNGVYKFNITGFPVNGVEDASNEVNGATLIVIYRDPNAAYQGSFTLWDGCLSANAANGYPTQSHTLTGFNACAAGTNTSAFLIVSDMQANVNGGNHQSNVAGVTATYPNNFWCVDQSVPTVTAGQTTATFATMTNTNAGDYYTLMLNAFYYQTTSCVVCNPPVLTITANSTTVACGASNGTVTATTVTGGTPPYTYVWNTTPPQSTQTATGLSAGTYTVTVTSGCLKGTQTVTVTGGGNIAPTLSPPSTICSGASVLLTAGGGTTYSWSPGGQTTASITIMPSVTTTYSVMISGGTCLDSANVTITVIPTPTPTLSPSSTICTGASVPLTAGGGTTYLWSPGGATTPSITVTPNATQIYSVTVSNGNCSSTLSDTETVATGITAHINNPPAICAGASATLIASGGSNYSWTPGGQTTPTIIVSPAATTTYSVIVSSGLCPADTASATIIINPIPAANYSNSIVCFNNPTVFTDMSTPAGGLIYSWSFGNTTTSNLQNPSLIFNAAGTYPVKLVVKTTAGGCVDSITKMVVINPLPVANFSSTPVCAGNPVCFKDASTIPTGTNTGWSWNFGDASPNSTQQNPCHTYSSAGTFSVTLTVTSDSGCQSTTVLPALVNPKPTANFTSTSPCLNASTALKDASTDVSLTDPITTWNWTMPGGNPTTAATQNTSTIYNTTGTHTITLIVTSKAGCSDTIAQPVTVYNPPVPNFSGSGDGCAPLCVNNYTDLSTSVDGTISGWLWTFPGGTPSISTAQNPGSICYKDSGAYGASLVVTTSFGCTDSITITPLINVRPWPKADFCVTPTQAPATDPTFNFCDLWTPNPGVVSWVWNFGDGSEDSTSLNPIHTYTAVTTNDFYFYTVKLIVRNQFGCWDTISKEVELIPEFTFYIPNSFTPNGDNFNDMFFGKGRGIKDYNIWLFDRWGNEIWDCSYSGKNTDWDGPNQDGMPSACKWDGTVIAGNPGITGGSGKQVQQDVYVWKVKLTDVFNMLHTYIGHVSVVK